MARQQSNTPVRTGYAAANGISYYYEIHGHGAPLLLLHGGFGSTAMFEPDIAALAHSREVIALDLLGHGRTALGDRAIDYLAMADDLAAVLEQLGYGAVADVRVLCRRRTEAGGFSAPARSHG